MNELDQFLERLRLLPLGYSEGFYHQRRYGTTLQISEDGRRVQLYARELGGRDLISFNLFRLASGEIRLKPCEMAKEKVVAFLIGYIPESNSSNPDGQVLPIMTRSDFPDSEP